MRRYIVAASVALVLAIVVKTYAQPTTVISFGPAVTVLNTASTGAVTGSTFALPGSNANVLTWQITADGSALSASLQVSLDGTNWITLSTCSTAAGCIYNAGVNAYVFVRVTQTSRTGGTVTTSSINTDRAYSTANGASPVLSGNLNFSPHNTYTIGSSVNALAPQFIYSGTGVYAGTSNFDSTRLLLGNSVRLQQAGDGLAVLGNGGNTDFSRLMLGGTTSAFPAIRRSGTTILFRLADDSNYTQVNLGSLLYGGNTFASLSADTNGTVRYCIDCLANSNPCTGASTGAFAKRLNGAWDCR